MIKKFSFILLGCFLIFGCADLPSPRDNDKKVSAADTAIKGALLAQVNDWAMGTVDFKEKLDALKTLLPEEAAQREFDNRETRLRILQELVNFEILAQEAEDRGLDKDRDVIDAVRNFKRNFLAQKLLGEIYQDIHITSIEIEEFYNRNKDIFREPEERRVREIVVNSEAHAKDILIRLLQGEDFSLLAQNHSISDSRRKGGDLGYFKIDQETTSAKKFPDFWRVVLTTDEGRNSSYFKGTDGKYYVLRVEDIRGGQVMRIEDVRENIREHLKGIQANNKRDEIIAAAKKKFEVTINEGLLE